MTNDSRYAAYRAYNGANDPQNPHQCTKTARCDERSAVSRLGDQADRLNEDRASLCDPPLRQLTLSSEPVGTQLCLSLTLYCQLVAPAVNRNDKCDVLFTAEQVFRYRKEV